MRLIIYKVASFFKKIKIFKNIKYTKTNKFHFQLLFILNKKIKKNKKNYNQIIF